MSRDQASGGNRRYAVFKAGYRRLSAGNDRSSTTSCDFDDEELNYA